MITVFLWGYTVFFPEDPVEIAAVVIADSIDDSVHRKRCPGQEPFRLLKFSLLQKLFEYAGDKAQIQKMMSVLLDNAVRYGDEKGRIEFSVCRERKTYIRVWNSCHFDSPPDLKRLFDRFYRPDSSRNTQTGGTGIGLSLAKAVAEKHGGTITARCPDKDSILFEAVL